jgi:hypothetical protein
VTWWTRTGIASKLDAEEWRDLVASHGYEDAASTDQDCRSQAISRFISDTVACLDRNG